MQHAALDVAAHQLFVELAPKLPLLLEPLAVILHSRSAATHSVADDNQRAN